MIKKLTTIIFMMVSITVSAHHSTSRSSTVSENLDGCTTGGINADYCVWTKEEFLEIKTTQEAVVMCNEYRHAHTEPDKNCAGVTAGYDPWPKCVAGSTCAAHKFWQGYFPPISCSEGEEVVVGEEGKGCQPIERDEGECNDKTNAGKSINTATGNEYHKEIIEIGNGFDLSLSYNSHIRYDEYGKLDYNHLAPGWTMSFNMYITPIYTVNNQEYVVVHRGNGRYLTFNKSGSQWLAEFKDKGNKLEQTANGWKLTSQSNQIETYTSNGKLSTIENNNSILSFTFSGNTINSVTNQNSNSIVFNGPWVNNQVGTRYNKITDNTGREWIFGYANSANHYNLISITYPDSTVKTFHYENSSLPYALTGITDRRGNPYVTYDYDSEGRVYHEQLAGGVEELTIAYNADNTRTITNSRGKVSTYTVERNNGFWQTTDILGPGCSNCSNANSSFVYDPATNDLLSKTVDGKTTKYGNYDSKGQYGYKIEAFGTTEQRQTVYAYDSRFFNKPITIIEPSVNGINKVTTNSYDTHANLTSVSNATDWPDGSTTVFSSVYYQYNAPFDQISQIDGPKAGSSDLTLFEYYADDANQGNNRGRLKKLTNAVGIILRDNIQYTATGKILSEDKPNGLTTSYTYYAGNDRLETINNTDGTKIISTHVSYLNSGEISAVTRNYNTVDASTLTLAYDVARRLTRVTDQQSNYVEYTLDTEGNQQFEKTYDPAGILKKSIAQIFDDYDQLDNSTQSGVTNYFNYGSDGNLYQQTNGNNVVTDYDYDALNRLTKITQDFGTGTLPTANTITQFEYNTHDRVKRVTDANGHDTVYEYDDLGRLLKLTSPDTGIDTFTYDGAGNVLSKLDANGNTTSFTYDDVDRPLTIDYVGTDLDVAFAYDELSVVLVGFEGKLPIYEANNGLNQLTSFSDSKNSTTFRYDVFGNLTNKTQIALNVTPSNHVNLELNYDYDNSNRMQSITYPSGLVVTYHYNNLNQVINISTNINGQNIDIVDNMGYVPMGPLQSMEMGNGLTYTASYDNGYRLDNFKYEATLSRGTSIPLSGNYSYDNNHNITDISREIVANNKSYHYDKLDRIDQEAAGSQVYTYNKLGNRTSSTDGTQSPIDYIYDPNSNKLSMVGNESRVYDSVGNTLSSSNGADNFTYNKANRLSSYSAGNTLKAEYYYNGIGQRILKKFHSNNGTVWNYLFNYNSQGQMMHEVSFSDGNFSSQRWEDDIIWLNNRPVALVRTVYNSGVTSQDIYYVLSDHLNTPRKLTDTNATVVWSWDSDAFGTTAENQDVDGDGTNVWFRLRFPGQYFDFESKSHYNYFRDYEPQTGRYLESDPIGLDGGVNTFGYVGGNPLIYIDELGLNCKYGGICPPPPTPKELCEAKCTLVAFGVCSGVSFGAGRKVFTTCMVVTGLETLGGSTPACGVLGFAAGIPLSENCKTNYIKICKENNKCCEKSD